MESKDVVIIGAGAAGLSCALYLKRAGVSFIILEKGAPGGKLLTIPHIDNYPGLMPLSGSDLAMGIYQSALNAGVEVSYGDVSSVQKNEHGDFIVDSGDESYLAKAVVVATGLSNVPSIKGEKALIGKGVSYCATCDGPLYKNKVGAIYSTGDRGLEEASYLSNVLKEVYVLTPDDQYQGSERLLESLKKKENVIFVNSAKLTEIKGEGHISSIVYQVGSKESELPSDVFFPLLGEKSASSFLSPLKIELSHGFIDVDSGCASSVKGLYAAGDIVNKKLRQVVTACSDGAIASNSIISYLRDKKKEAGL